MMFGDKCSIVCKTIKIVQIWCKTNNRPYVLNNKFVKRVLNKFFPDCHAELDIEPKDLFFFKPMILSFFRIAIEPTSYAINDDTITILFKFLLKIFYKIFLSISEMVSLQNYIPGLENGYIPLQILKYAIIYQQWKLFSINMKPSNILYPIAKNKKNTQNIISAILSCIASLYNFDKTVKINDSHVHAAVSCITKRYQQIAKEDAKVQILTEEELKDIPEIEEEIKVPSPKDDDLIDFDNDVVHDDEYDDVEEKEFDYGEELQELDEDAYYNGIIASIDDHLKQIGDYDYSVIPLIEQEAEKIKYNYLTINFYALE